MCKISRTQVQFHQEKSAEFTSPAPNSCTTHAHAQPLPPSHFSPGSASPWAVWQRYSWLYFCNPKDRPLGESHNSLLTVLSFWISERTYRHREHAFSKEGCCMVQLGHGRLCPCVSQLLHWYDLGRLGNIFWNGYSLFTEINTVALILCGLSQAIKVTMNPNPIAF